MSSQLLDSPLTVVASSTFPPEVFEYLDLSIVKSKFANFHLVVCCSLPMLRDDNND